MKYEVTIHLQQTTETTQRLRPPNDDPCWHLQEVTPYGAGFACVWYAESEREDFVKLVRALRGDIGWAYSVCAQALQELKHSGRSDDARINIVVNNLEGLLKQMDGRRENDRGPKA